MSRILWIETQTGFVSFWFSRRFITFLLSLKGCHKGIFVSIVENLIEWSLWRVLCLWLLRTLSNVLFEGYYVYDYINEYSLLRIVIKGYLFMIIENLIECSLWRIVIKGYLFMIIENLNECSLWRIVIKGLCLWILRTLSNVLLSCHKGLYVYDYIIECSHWRVVWKGLCLWLLTTLWKGSIEGLS
jgi:hypothetical protein